MDYLTNYYKNLSEQLQEKFNNLEQLLEYRKKSTTYLDVVDVDPYTGEDAPRIIGTEVTKKGNPMGKGAKKEKTVSIYPGMGAIQSMGSDQEELAWETVRDSGRPTVENNPIYASMHGKGPAIQVKTAELFQDSSDIRTKGGSIPGTGQKLRQKNYAQRMAGYRDLHPDVHDSADPDTIASAIEVVASQQRRQLGQ